MRPIHQRLILWVVTISVAFAAAYYDRGAQIWHMLNGLMGDTQFQQLMVKFASHQPWEPLYYEQALADARTIGGQKVADFFGEWVARAAEPSLEYRDVQVSKEDTSYTIRGIIHQHPEQGSQPWRLESDLAIYQARQEHPAQLVPLTL